jgi:cell division cycle 14
LTLNWYNPSSFKVQEYEFYEKVDNGDMNWIIPNKFIAFSSPSQETYDIEGFRTYTPDDYIPLFKKWRVNVVVRLNKATYDGENFTKNGIKLAELFFEDGTVPPDVIIFFYFKDIIDEFLRISEFEKYGLAVHCKVKINKLI